MKRLLFALCLAAILCAEMTVELEEKSSAFVEYRIEERGASDSRLTLVVEKDGVQHLVEQVDGFDGLYTGQFMTKGPGTYTLTAYNLNTSSVGEGSVTIAPLASEPEIRESLEEIEEEYIEEQTSFQAVEEQLPWLPYLIVVLAVIIVALLLFGNPLKKPKKKR